MDANVSFSGNLGTDVDYVEGRGWCAARFRVAHTPRRLVDGTWVDGNTTWLTVRTSGRLARNCRDSLVKGDPSSSQGVCAPRCGAIPTTRNTRVWPSSPHRWGTIWLVDVLNFDV